MDRSSRIPKLAIAVVALTLTLAPPALLRADTRPLPDASIQQILAHRLAEHDLAGRVHVTVEATRVTLSGSVDTLAEKKLAERLAAGVDDVSGVRNELNLVPTSLSDQEIADRVSKRLRNSVYFSIFDWVEGKVDHGVVTLQGSVVEPWKRDSFAELVERVPGVTAVENAIDVLPVSINDQDIRFILARRIYGDLALDRYAIGAHPPIHIIVDNGKVTLKGAVATRVDKVLAGSIARTSVLSFGVVNDLRVDSDQTS